jgi:hypothetical protein
MYSPKSLAPDRARFPVTSGVLRDALNNGQTKGRVNQGLALSAWPRESATPTAA